MNAEGKGNVYDWLYGIRDRPEMWLVQGKDRLQTIETLTHGYYAALSKHNISEDVPELNNSKFSNWLHEKTGIGAALGWSHIIYELHTDEGDAFESFFVYLEEYRNELRH